MTFLVESLQKRRASSQLYALAIVSLTVMFRSSSNCDQNSKTQHAALSDIPMTNGISQRAACPRQHVHQLTSSAQIHRACTPTSRF